MNYKYERYFYSTYYWENGGGNLTDEGAGTSVTGYDGYAFSSSVGYYVTGPYITVTDPNRPVFSSGGSALQIRFIDTGRIMSYWMYAASSAYKTTYIDTIISADGTYPDNGISGSYWYVKTTPIIGKVRVDSAWKDRGGVRLVRIEGNVWKNRIHKQVRTAEATWKTIF